MITPEFERRSTPGARPWLHLLNRPQESEALVRTLKGHKNKVWDCTFSPDGKLIASASADGTLKLWEVDTGKVKATLKGHTVRVRSCAFSPDGKLIVSASMDKTLKLWDVATGKEKTTLKGHSDWVRSCAFSPDGRLIVSGSWDRTLKLWEVDTGKEIASFPALWELHCVAFNPIGFKACCGDSGGNRYILRLVGFELTHPIKTPLRDPDLFSAESQDTLSQQTESSPEATTASHFVYKNELRRSWLASLFYTGLSLGLFLVGYGLTRLSPWFWIVAVPLFIIGSFYFLMNVYVRECSCPYCGAHNFVLFSYQNLVKCRVCKETFIMA